MAKLLGSSSSYAIFFLSLFLLLLISAEMPTTEAGNCEKRSTTWSGPCLNTGNCDRQCKDWEHALHGACHAQFPGFACFCYFC
ncbi:defensin-like protein 1 [Tripterygium wilfordii]|uniref:defensin-like protein 1 n=1 Tax=Tripterygium wilfordii TaxID=458696 RepID=UPI0018F831FA|nr:defensin-like protein 1 [Tripterygium wilfordii]